MLVLGVQAFEFVLVGKEGLVQSGHFIGGKQRNVLIFNQACVHQLIDLHAVIQMADTVFLHTAVVFQHQQAFRLNMPQRIKQGGRTAAHTALRARFHSRLKHFEKWNAACVLCFAATDFATQTADTAGIDTDTGTLRNVFHDGRRGGIDAVQAVIAFNQYAGTELARRRADAGHNRCRQRDFELGNRVVKAFHIIQPCIFRIFGKQAHRHQNIQKLRAFVDLFGNAVLDEVFAFQLFHGRIGKVQIALVVDILV